MIPLTEAQIQTALTTDGFRIKADESGPEFRVSARGAWRLCWNAWEPWHISLRVVEPNGIMVPMYDQGHLIKGQPHEVFHTMRRLAVHVQMFIPSHVSRSIKSADDFIRCELIDRDMRVQVVLFGYWDALRPKDEQLLYQRLAQQCVRCAGGLSRILTYAETYPDACDWSDARMVLRLICQIASENGRLNECYDLMVGRKPSRTLKAPQPEYKMTAEKFWGLPA